MTTVSGVSSEQIHLVWKEARDLLIPALERTMGRLDEASVLRALLEKKMQLWCVWDGDMIAAVITQISVWPTGMKTARLVAAGGVSIDKWVGEMSVIEEWARHNGCSLLEAGGRPGWIKKFPDWEQTAVELTKDLSNA